ncbi:hypothetical protein DRB96_12720 [Streptomyces sp. ICC1]|nr:hypothetical protein DRB89_03945 [Streptomyces sp. ICC4]AWZ13033.1 hypothetical protein DRB96_12720 [Streptomyces sp. ICC1]
MGERAGHVPASSMAHTGCDGAVLGPGPAEFGRHRLDPAPGGQCVQPGPAGLPPVTPRAEGERRQVPRRRTVAERTARLEDRLGHAVRVLPHPVLVLQPGQQLRPVREEVLGGTGSSPP